MARKTIAEFAAEHLRENDIHAIMWGDVRLVHEILDRAGRPHRGPRSCRLLLNALEGSPLFKKKTAIIGGRRFRDFHLADASEQR